MELGYLTFAIGESYLRHAYAQALSIKCTQKNSNYAVVLDKKAAALIEPKHEKVFDHIIPLNYEPIVDWDMKNECRALELSPFKETIKLDSDMLFTSSIDHWWPILRNRDVVFTTQVHNFREEPITLRDHRSLFDSNLLPNVYSAFFYFRYSRLSVELFQAAKAITSDWDWVAQYHLINNRDDRIRTDEVFALAVQMVGEEQCTLPYAVPSFVHMKNFLNGLSANQNWHEQIYSTVHNSSVTIGNYKQRLPFHYHEKGWLSDEIISNYERHYRELL
jgi:hypothetical protein